MRPRAAREVSKTASSVRLKRKDLKVSMVKPGFVLFFPSIVANMAFNAIATMDPAEAPAITSGRTFNPVGF